MFSGFYREIIREFGTRAFNDIQRRAKNISPSETKKFDFATDAIRSYIATTTAEKVVLINDTTKNKIKNIIQFNVSTGESVDTIADYIDSLYLDQIIPNRSRTIARTEVVSTSNYGSLAGAEQTTPKLKKVWIPTFDDVTRESHLDMANHPPIGLKESFDVGDSTGSYPGDFNLPPEEVINCRCAIGYEYGDGED
jgi:hypothetical protein